jgi:hypothetical protein
MDISVFENMTDEDFFSNKLTHIYFNEYVSNESIEKLIKKINEATKETKTEAGAIIKPKPIPLLKSYNFKMIDSYFP